ncbi:hypothetical protein DH2020_027226 [Rehmannia glutinosa]|uniref:TF-B3 domain-containing protein n=1 Tax=Rehmannia glutinosa TaxID=99300 RepID=A0ABR0VUQ0_REHGL
MVNDCMECRNKEEEMYWSHFQTVQFCQFLTGRFDQQLYKKEDGRNSSFERSSGHVWNVGLVTNGDTLLLKQGWESFIEDHSLEENDILIFKYNGMSRFDVSIFDQESLCEKATSYFVKKCEHTESGHGSKRSTSVEEISEDSSESSDDVSVGRRVKRRMSKTARTPPSRIQPTRSTSKRPRGTNTKRGSSRGYPLQLKSRRRKVTEDETKRAQQMAAEASSENSFVVVMRASHVYKGFFMSIPAEWAKVHLPKGSQDIELRVKDKRWVAKYHYKGYGGGLTNGWKKFVVDNFLEEFDVCVFDLTSGTPDNFVLDVKIFRVVEEVIPPSVARGRRRLILGE